MRNSDILQIKQISRFYELCGLGKVKHPLIGIHQLKDIVPPDISEPVRYTLAFYVITIKHNCTCKSLYGQTTYDYNEGVMGFIAPMQVLTVAQENITQREGWCLTFHPDLLLGSDLACKIKAYQYFYYHVNEALILSGEEERDIETQLQEIKREIERPVDSFSQDILVARLDLFLQCCNRFYARQFITRKPLNSQLLTTFEGLLTAYLADQRLQAGLPTVGYFAGKLNISPKYLSDMLKQLTGLTAQQHIHEKLIEKAKEQLSLTHLSVSEIAYQLGFEHSQSFSKFFKSKTSQSPVAFKSLFS